ncbi:hypothetical protein BDV36DRAFT_297429 [Aspergillus pseudocaelatus]|uniref:Uncharacterized protein n=1 Tax=Aspergillus pseudocaelatus TaxID=1825620 RepID=A0ABQ6WG49_9EURO|nr:hypothetical protein BDV36DRAFT_297429 [Aspergillus pseudocaelatus]
MRFQQLALFGLVALAAAVPLSAKDNRAVLASEASLSPKNRHRDISARATIPGLRGDKVNLIVRGETATNGTRHGKDGEGGKQGGEDEDGEDNEEGKDEDDEDGDNKEGDEGGESGDSEEGEEGHKGHKGPHGGQHGQEGHDNNGQAAKRGGGK